MRVLLASSAFHTVGGSETYLMTLAEHLIRLGHGVRIFATTAGDMAELARRQGIPVVSDPDDLGEPADAVVSQDSAIAYQVAAAWPQVPQVFVCHSSLFDFQQPPLVPGVAHTVVVLNDRVRRRVEALNADLRVVRLRQPIDTQRFSPRSAPAAKPRRALIFSNYLAAEMRRALVETWEAAGLEVVEIGRHAQVTLTPEEGIDDADIIVAKGRAALEAMSCGRPTYLFDAFGGDGWITPESYPDIEADGITGSASERLSSTEQLRADLELYDPELGRIGRELVSRHHDARHHAAELLDLLREAAPAERTAPTLEAELVRQVRLRWAADSELFTARATMQRMSDLADAQIAQAEARIVQLTTELELSRQDAANLREIRAGLEAKVDDLRERARADRLRIQRLRAKLEAAESTPDKPQRWCGPKG